MAEKDSDLEPIVDVVFPAYDDDDEETPEQKIERLRYAVSSLKTSLHAAYAMVRRQADEIRQLKSELERVRLTPEAAADVEGAFIRGRQQTLRRVYSWLQYELSKLDKELAETPVPDDLRNDDSGGVASGRRDS